MTRAPKDTATTGRGAADLPYRLDWRATGVRIGAHRGKMEGTGGLFRDFDTQMRSPDPRRIDLRMSMRDPNETLYVRRFEQKTAITVYALVDLSASMSFAGSVAKMQVVADLCAALAAATRDAERVWPVFVADPDLLDAHAPATARTAWFEANLRALDERLRDEGSGLTVLRGRPEEVLPTFAAEIGADIVHAAADEDPVAIARDERVAATVDLRLADDQRIVPPAELRTGGGTAYTVYTPFRRALDERIARNLLLAFEDAHPQGEIDDVVVRQVGREASAQVFARGDEVAVEQRS